MTEIEHLAQILHGRLNDVACNAHVVFFTQADMEALLSLAGHIMADLSREQDKNT